jgi:hypothetical protein
VTDGVPGPWVAPDAPPAASPTAQPQTPAPPPARPDPSRAGPVGPRPPVPLRPMTPSDLLDGAFTVLKASPANLLAVTALFVIPIQLVTAWLQRDALAAFDLGAILAGDEAALDAAAEDDAGTGATVVSLLGSSVALAFVCAATTALVLARHRGQDPSLGDLLRVVVRRGPALLVAWTVVHLAQAVGLLALGVGALVAMALFLVTSPAVVAEDLGPLAAMGRSYRLTRRRFWPSLGIALLTGVVAFLFDQALSSAPVLLAGIVGTDGPGWVLLAVGGVMSSIITTPVVAAATTLFYLDLRVRTEGLDLEVVAATVLPAAAPASS